MADVYKRSVRSALYLERNGLPWITFEHYREDVTCVEHTHQRVVLSTNMATAQEFDLSGVSTGAVIMFTTDRAVKLALNAASNMISVGDNGMFMASASFTHVFVQNESTTYTATVELLVTD